MSSKYKGEPILHGGAREGSGRKPSETEHDYITVRVEKKVVDKLRRKYKRGEVATHVRKFLTTL